MVYPLAPPRYVGVISDLIICKFIFPDSWKSYDVYNGGLEKWKYTDIRQLMEV
jgi:hypothetical protein